MLQRLEVPFSGHGQLGEIALVESIASTKGPFRTFPHMAVKYPPIVVEALGQLYERYNAAFADPIALNCEWDTDYALCYEGGRPLNRWVQIDMVGLPDPWLQALSSLSVEEVVDVLRRRIVYEIENSLAMYQLLGGLFENSAFKERFHASLEAVRARYGRRIVLLAVTREKYAAMLAEEFGRTLENPPTDADVRRMSGFDALWGPDQFLAHLAEHGGVCQALLYVRSSDPVAKLKKPSTVVEHPLLSDPALRKIIRANALTINVDDPASDRGRMINDTKAYMPELGMGFLVTEWSEVVSPDFARHLAIGLSIDQFVGNPLSDKLTSYLISCGSDPGAVASGSVRLHAKPLKCAYGCYGHVSGSIGDRDFRSDLRRELKVRGPYIVQIAMAPPLIRCSKTGACYNYIDRNFMSMVDGRVVFMGGFRSFMPVETIEAKKGRIHGNDQTVWAPII